LKDLPAELPEGLCLAAVPGREDPRDVLVLPTPAGGSPEVPLPPEELGIAWGSAELLGELRNGARVGSSSFRRSAQLLHARPDLRVESVRGNVDTRLRKLDSGDYDALVLAAAGLRRLGLQHRISAALPVEVSTPAPGQGALGLESRADDPATRGLLARLDDATTRACVSAERALMDALGGGCSIPLGAYAWMEEGVLRLAAVIALPDGSRLLRETSSGSPDQAEALGLAVSDALVAAGAREILDHVRR
jgi:hydroxymethylbilane synthase